MSQMMWIGINQVRSIQYKEHSRWIADVRIIRRVASTLTASNLAGRQTLSDPYQALPTNQTDQLQ